MAITPVGLAKSHSGCGYLPGTKEPTATACSDREVQLQQRSTHLLAGWTNECDGRVRVGKVGQPTADMTFRNQPHVNSDGNRPPLEVRPTNVESLTGFGPLKMKVEAMG